MKIYQGSLPFYHIDAYRLEGITQDLGFEEVFADEGVCVVEWPQYIEYTLPKERLELTITNQEGEKRLIMINGIGERYRKLEEEL